MEPEIKSSQSTLEKLSVPIAIIIAGALIAGAFYYSSGKTPVQTGTNPTPLPGASMKPVSASDHIIGNPNADLIVVEYSDLECPFCKSFNTTMNQIMSDYGSSGKVAWVFRQFPIVELHPKAEKEAEATECVNELGGTAKFWQYVNLVYTTTNSNNSLDDGVYNTPKTPPTDSNGNPYYTQKTPRSKTDAGQLSDMAKQVGVDVTAFENCLASGKYASAVQASYNDGVAAGVQGTPMSFIIAKDGTKTPIQGAQPYANLKATIDALLSK